MNIERDIKFKIISKLYYPVQYLLFRLLILGTNLQPTLADVFYGFRIPEITTVVYDFMSGLPEILNAEHYFFIVFNFLPYLVRFFWEMRNILFFGYASYGLIIFIIASIDNMSYKPINASARVVTYIGGPGSGKTSKALYDSVNRSRQMWTELSFLYWSYKSQIGEWIVEGNTKKIHEWQEIRDSYEYYITTDCVPCLWTNIPVMVDGRYSSILTEEHAYQLKRVPYKSVMFFDEGGGSFAVDDYKSKPLEVSDFFRLERHFGDWYIYMTEQDSSNVYIDVRRVVGYNEYMLGQKWVIQPLLLLLPYKLLKRFFATAEKGNRRLARFLSVYYSLIRYIGFRKYKTVQEANTERGATYEPIKVNTVYLPTYLNCVYDDRTFREFYAAKDMEIETAVHKSLVLPKTEETSVAFLRNAKAELAAEQERTEHEQALRLADSVLDNTDLKKEVMQQIEHIESRKKLSKKILEHKLQPICENSQSETEKAHRA